MSDDEVRIGNVLPLFDGGGIVHAVAQGPERATVRLAMLLVVVRGGVEIAKWLGGGAILLLAADGLLALAGR